MAKVHTVGPHDDAQSIATQYGYASGKDLVGASAKGEASANAKLNPDQLYPGQQLVIPDPDTSKEESLKTEAENFFTLNVPRRIFSTTLCVDDGKTRTPRKNVPYTLRVGEWFYNGTTDSSGKVEHEIPSTHALALLQVEGDFAAKTYWVGKLCPMKDAPDGGVMGVVQRLSALGYSPGPMDKPIRARYEPEVVAFKKRVGLKEPGPTLDQELFDALTKEYGQ